MGKVHNILEVYLFKIILPEDGYLWYNYDMMEEVHSLEQSIGKASTRAKNKYRDKTYDRVEITLPKGRKAELQAHAEQRGESLNGFIGRPIDEQVKRDTDE